MKSDRPTRVSSLRSHRYRKATLFENGIAMNETASEIYDLCDGTRRIGDIMSEIGKTYQTSGVDIETDIRECLQSLAENGMISLDQ